MKWLWKVLKWSVWATAGLVVLVIALVMILGPAAPAKKEAGTAVAASEQSNASGVMPQLPAAFTGMASVPTAKNWPKVAEVDLPQSDDEKRYLSDSRCFDESECYGAKRLRKYIFKRYPDIARVTYRPEKDEASDRDVVEKRKEDFFQALYFAKQIQLANGQSLYDFMRTCAQGFTALDGAEFAYDNDGKGKYFDIRLYPKLKRADSGEPEEMSILFERRGDKLIAGSPFFTTNALRYPNFLQRHNLTCWNGRVPEI
ncbi:hypothetical protein ACQUJT_11870 [Ralstonia pseudosolanacearum]